jgi:hypothetical protein
MSPVSGFFTLGLIMNRALRIIHPKYIATIENNVIIKIDHYYISQVESILRKSQLDYAVRYEEYSGFFIIRIEK